MKRKLPLSDCVQAYKKRSVFPGLKITVLTSPITVINLSMIDFGEFFILLR